MKIVAKALLQATTTLVSHITLHAPDQRIEGGRRIFGRQPQGESGEDTPPLVQIAQFPEDLARRELSVNQFRAREIAKDVDKYSKRCPKGFVLESSDMKKILAAKEGDRLHNQSISRVIDFLNRFAKGVEAVEEGDVSKQQAALREKILR